MDYIKYEVLGPKRFSGSIHGDYGYEINGEKSEKGYVSYASAQNAMYRKLKNISNNN